MKNPVFRFLMVSFLMEIFLLMNAIAGENGGKQKFPTPQIPFHPKRYICYRAEKSLRIDGQLNESSWKKAQWTDNFMDIRGRQAPKPRFRTRVKMLWDSTYFYVAAQLEEPDVWATLTNRDAVIYHDNDFEVFIDPDGDTHDYYEFEMNALNTVWDLLLTRPYRDEGDAVNDWDIHGIKTAVYVNGTLNRPGDRDDGWTAEIAFPWEALAECSHKEAPPRRGDQWRVNFSRVEWQVKVENEKYVKVRDPKTGKPFSEDNWVWSPQGLINMHYPEMWGVVQFSAKNVGSAKVAFRKDKENSIKWDLRKVYYAERTYFLNHQAYSSDIPIRWLPIPGFKNPPSVVAGKDFFVATLRSEGSSVRWHIREDGRVWKGKN